MSFTIFYNGKAPFWAKKTRSPKRRKIEIFQKGLTHGFWSKNGHFPQFFFMQSRPGKLFLRYFTMKKRLSGL